LSPGRTDSGYRLYSAQDIERLRWLKARTEEGVSISQALIMLSAVQIPPPVRAASRPLTEAGGLAGVRSELLSALLTFDETRADQLLAEAFAAFGAESLGEHIIAPLMADIGRAWLSGDVTTAGEHFASHYLRRKLDAIISAAPRRDEGTPIVLGCAPEDWHELGILLLHLFLRRRGFNVLYLGQSVPVDQFADEMRRLRPALVVISAATELAFKGLIELANTVQSMGEPRPLFGFGGVIFSSQPHLRASVPGIFLGESPRQAADRISSLLEDRNANSKTGVLGFQQRSERA
jgi:methanogenic corrinoid protein MtbC1